MEHIMCDLRPKFRYYLQASKILAYRYKLIILKKKNISGMKLGQKSKAWRLKSKDKYITLCQKCPYSELFWSVFSAYGIQSECGKIRTRITPNTDTFCILFENHSGNITIAWKISSRYISSCRSHYYAQLGHALQKISFAYSTSMPKVKTLEGVWLDPIYLNLPIGPKINVNKKDWYRPHLKDNLILIIFY